MQVQFPESNWLPHNIYLTIAFAPYPPDSKPKQPTPMVISTSAICQLGCTHNRAKQMLVGNIQIPPIIFLVKVVDIPRLISISDAFPDAFVKINMLNNHQNLD